MSSESLPKPKRRRTSKSKDEQDIRSNYYTSMFLQHGDESNGMTTQVVLKALSAYWGVFLLFLLFVFWHTREIWDNMKKDIFTFDCRKFWRSHHIFTFACRKFWHSFPEISQIWIFGILRSSLAYIFYVL